MASVGVGLRGAAGRFALRGGRRGDAAIFIVWRGARVCRVAATFVALRGERFVAVGAILFATRDVRFCRVAAGFFAL